MDAEGIKEDPTEGSSSPKLGSRRKRGDCSFTYHNLIFCSCVCVYVYVCVCVCVCGIPQAHTRTHMHTHANAHTYVHIHRCVDICTHECTSARTMYLREMTQ